MHPEAENSWARLARLEPAASIAINYARFESHARLREAGRAWQFILIERESNDNVSSLDPIFGVALADVVRKAELLDWHTVAGLARTLPTNLESPDEQLLARAVELCPPGKMLYFRRDQHEWASTIDLSDGAYSVTIRPSGRAATFNESLRRLIARMTERR